MLAEALSYESVEVLRTSCLRDGQIQDGLSELATLCKPETRQSNSALPAS